MAHRLVGTSVGRAEEKLGNLRYARPAAEVETAFDLQVGRLGLIPDGDHVIENAPQGTLAERDEIGGQHHALRLGRRGSGRVCRHSSILPLSPTPWHAGESDR